MRYAVHEFGPMGSRASVMLASYPDTYNSKTSSFVLMNIPAVLASVAMSATGVGVYTVVPYQHYGGNFGAHAKFIHLHYYYIINIIIIHINTHYSR